MFSSAHIDDLRRGVYSKELLKPCNTPVWALIACELYEREEEEEMRYWDEFARRSVTCPVPGCKKKAMAPHSLSYHMFYSHRKWVHETHKCTGDEFNPFCFHCETNRDFERILQKEAKRRQKLIGKRIAGEKENEKRKMKRKKKSKKKTRATKQDDVSLKKVRLPDGSFSPFADLKNMRYNDSKMFVSQEAAYAEAKADSGGKEPMHHPQPRKKTDLPHYHIHGHHELEKRRFGRLMLHYNMHYLYRMHNMRHTMGPQGENESEEEIGTIVSQLRMMMALDDDES